MCRAAAKEVSIPVIPVETPGFIGDKNIGNRLAGELLLEHVIGTAEPEALTPYDVNLIGEYNIAGDLWGMLPLFERLGIRVLSCISGDARFEDLRYAHRARLNVIICSKSLTNLARKMKKRWGIPYLEESFYGMTDTARALRDMAQELDLANGGANGDAGAGRGADRGGGGALPRAHRAVPGAARGQARGPLHRRREDLVDGERAPRARASRSWRPARRTPPSRTSTG